MVAVHTATLIGMFDDPRQAEGAVAELCQAGFREDQVGLVVKVTDEEYDTEEDAISGAVAGSLGGAAVGALVTLALPGLGPLVATTLLAAALEGATAGALAGGLVGALVGVGIPEHEAQYYEEALRAGQALVTIEASEGQEQAQAILLRAGAREVRVPRWYPVQLHHPARPVREGRPR